MNLRFDRFLIFICTCLFMFNVTGSRPLIPLYSSELGASNTQIGVIVALFSFLPMFLAIKLGKLIDSTEMKYPLIFSVLLGSLSMILPYAFPNIMGVYFSQVIIGLSQLTYVLCIQSYSGQFSKRKLRDYYIAVFSVGVAVGSFLGPLASGFLTDIVGFLYTFIILGMISLFSFPLLFLYRSRRTKVLKEINIEHSKDKSYDLLFISDLRKAFIVSAIVLFAKDMYVAFFPLLASNKGISTTVIGIIVSLNAAAGIIIRIVLPYIVDKVRVNVVISSSIIIAGSIFILNPLISDVYLLSIMAFLLGISLGIGQPLSISSTITSLPMHRVGEGLGLRLSFNKLTQFIAPLTIGTASGIIGMGGVFMVSGVIMIIGIFSPKKFSESLRKRVKNKIN